MEYGNPAIIIGVNYRKIEEPPSTQHFFADIVLIDRSHDILAPVLYQLRNESQENNLFALMGEVLALDKGKKLIYLTKNLTVSYKHLILATGLSQDSLGATYDEELRAGVHALIEALKIRKNIHEALNYPHPSWLDIKLSMKNTRAQDQASRPIPLKDIQKLISTMNKLAGQKTLDMSLGGTERRLYEVFL